MQNISTTIISSEKNSFSFEGPDNFVSSVNGYPIDQGRLRLLSTSLSEYMRKRYFKDGFSKNKKTPLNDLKEERLNNKRKSLFKDIEKPLEDLGNKICNIYHEHKEKNWDGYGAEPIKYLEQSLQFATDLFSVSRILVESVDIIPENDGCLCFEWFKSDSKYVNVAVKGDKLIYTYKLGDEKACGEVTYSGKQAIIEQIKKIA